MSTALRTLSLAAAPRFSHTLLAAPRPLSPLFRAPQLEWQSSTPFSTSQPLRMKYPYDRPQISTTLMTRIFYKPDGQQRSKLKLKRLVIGLTLFLAYSWDAAARKLAKLEEEQKRLKCFMRVQRAIYKLSFVDVDDPLVLSSIVEAIFRAFEDKLDKESDIDIETYFAEVNAYFKSHASELKELKIDYEEREKIFEIKPELYCLSVNAKVVLAVFCFRALEEIKKDIVNTEEVLRTIDKDLIDTIEIIGDIIAHDIAAIPKGHTDEDNEDKIRGQKVSDGVVRLD